MPTKNALMRNCIGKEEIMFRRILFRGALAAIRFVLLRHTEAKFCSTTGLIIKNPYCQIDSPLILHHGLSGIIIARNVRIGKNVQIYQHVTIAEANKNRTTVIEDGVMIGAGAVILKNMHIGKNTKIGANAVVMCDIPEGATAVGAPAKIIER